MILCTRYIASAKSYNTCEASDIELITASVIQGLLMAFLIVDFSVAN